MKKITLKRVGVLCIGVMFGALLVSWYMGATPYTFVTDFHTTERTENRDLDAIQADENVVLADTQNIPEIASPKEKARVDTPVTSKEVTAEEEWERILSEVKKGLVDTNSSVKVFGTGLWGDVTWIDVDGQQYNLYFKAVLSLLGADKESQGLDKKEQRQNLFEKEMDTVDKIFLAHGYTVSQKNSGVYDPELKNFGGYEPYPSLQYPSYQRSYTKGDRLCTGIQSIDGYGYVDVPAVSEVKGNWFKMGCTDLLDIIKSEQKSLVQYFKGRKDLNHARDGSTREVDMLRINGAYKNFLQVRVIFEGPSDEPRSGYTAWLRKDTGIYDVMYVYRDQEAANCVDLNQAEVPRQLLINTREKCLSEYVPEGFWTDIWYTDPKDYPFDQ